MMIQLITRRDIIKEKYTSMYTYRYTDWICEKVPFPHIKCDPFFEL